jgi:retinol dehydrogenase 12
MVLTCAGRLKVLFPPQVDFDKPVPAVTQIFDCEQLSNYEVESGGLVQGQRRQPAGGRTAPVSVCRRKADDDVLRGYFLITRLRQSRGSAAMPHYMSAWHKVVLITGATAGIGRVTARELADAGAHVLLAARNKEKAEATREWISRETGNRSVDLIIGDLSIQSHVRSIAQQVASRHGGLDVLVNNAGGFFQRRTESADGIEMTFALNHLASFLLTHLLLEALKRRSPSRVVTVSSDAHTRASMNFDDLEGRVRYRGWGAYGRSKLANILFTYELARRLHGTGVTANALHPGFVASEFGKNNGPGTRLAMSIAHRLGAISVEEGARTSVYLATSKEVQDVSGKYFVSCREAASTAASHYTGAMLRLWEISTRMTGLATGG